VLGYAPYARTQLLAVGQVSVLVQYRGQFTHAVIESLSLETPSRVVNPPPAPLLERFLHQPWVALLEKTQELIGQLPVALGPQTLGGRRQAEAPPRPTGTRTLVTVSDEPFSAEDRKLLPHRANRHSHHLGDGLGRSFPGVLDVLQDGPSRRRHGAQTDP
jgi:hypothetical protein